MIGALNPFNYLYPAHPAPLFTSSLAIKRVLDIEAKTDQFDFSPTIASRLLEGSSFLQGRVRDALYIVAIPLRITLIILYAFAQIIRECPRHSIGEQHRVISRICSATAMSLSQSLSSYVYALVFPGVHVRTQNIVDVRSASVYAQGDIQPRVHKPIFGAYPFGEITGPVDLSTTSGLCWGKSQWLIAMYLHGKIKWANNEERLKAITRLYAMGSTPESALIQALGNRIHETKAPLETLLDRIIRAVKPVWLQSHYRGLYRYVEARVFGDRNPKTFAQEVAYCRHVADLSLKNLREEVRLGSLLNLSMTDGYRFAPERGRTGHQGWLGSIFRSDYPGFEGIRDLSDGVYLITSENPWPGTRHAMVYIRDQGGKRGYVFDPNVGLEILDGRDHWKSVAALGPRIGHQILNFVKVEKRSILDMFPFDLQRRWAEFTC